MRLATRLILLSRTLACALLRFQPTPRQNTGALSRSVLSDAHIDKRYFHMTMSILSNRASIESQGMSEDARETTARIASDAYTGRMIDSDAHFVAHLLLGARVHRTKRPKRPSIPRGKPRLRP